LRDIADQTWKVIMARALRDLESKWQEDVYGAFWRGLSSL